ncbi:serine hydrolase domain-containing protein [Thermomonospora umbrina]|uniref:CubicO group peptidase (Beta-lactamase class C family) n=1 Tax=Thermomonospora umbrina TaxID=111806 RepID=A0A3D9SVK6_9ACTN|nr:serine hydrolase domain-containing protein [Thermomonospora umbrina]REE99838.1 CubicO group peptidase (beta-lactamase class C family) [Thermomonospora umbrina]
MTVGGLDELLEPVVAAAGGASAVVTGIVRGDERAVRRHGTLGRTGVPRTVPADLDTRFEIGSLTKTFTALLLAEMAADGLVRLDDPVDLYLPADARLPASPGPPVTLLHLATHTSGLPRLPPGLLARAARHWFTNPYAAFGTADLMAALPRARPRFTPGRRVSYSNFGVGLLGVALSHAAGEGYEGLLHARVVEPLDLTDTDGDPYGPQATGHWHGRPRPPWLIPGLAAAGALRSTGRDLLRYVSALLDPASVAVPSLSAALADVRRPRPVGPTGRPRCLVWNLRRETTHDLVHHSGATRGFTAFVGFGPGTGTGIVALANTTSSMRSPFIQAAYDALRAVSAGKPTYT